MFFENCQKSRQQGLADEEWVGLREGASESTPVRERSTEWPIEEEDASTTITPHPPLPCPVSPLPFVMIAPNPGYQSIVL
ncbi:hypothetical protein HZH68_015757 [Vespula germanica]|uniref:Uncharacterized protein n=1 Tax=Vespula germanica TaxID=30212 RepID=A0A834J7J0_VESGE|nr:hypothetical protein HZH68_015757 [Vespula germanica]